MSSWIIAAILLASCIAGSRILFFVGLVSGKKLKVPVEQLRETVCHTYSVAARVAIGAAIYMVLVLVIVLTVRVSNTGFVLFSLPFIAAVYMVYNCFGYAKGIKFANKLKKSPVE